ncbi:MAG: HD domain-containing protein [Nitrospirae bacterium]|nr:HD domain-containing protein [Nitrospirota bacterium]
MSLLIFIILAGERIVYDGDIGREDELAKNKIRLSEKIIKKSIKSYKNNLLMMTELPEVSTYVESDFTSKVSETAVCKSFVELAAVFKDFFWVRIIDADGMERVKIENKSLHSTPNIIPKKFLKSIKGHYYLNNTLNLKNKQVYYSKIDTSYEDFKDTMNCTAVLRVSTPLFNSRNELKGVLIFNINISEILTLLPSNAFIQTADNYRLYLKDNRVVFEDSDYNIKTESGMMKISDSKHIHFDTIEFSPDNKLIICINEENKELKYSFLSLIVIFMVVVLIFSILLFFIGKMFYQRFNDFDLSQKALVSSLAALADGRDPETGSHLERTKQYSMLLAQELQKQDKYKGKVTNDFIQDIYNAASLHDIGKVGIPDSILLKPAKLTEDEFNAMKSHVIIGSKILNSAIERYGLSQSLFIIARNICAYHHEKFNGKGYTKGLIGDAIPLEARIFAVCDVYDALRSKRPYKEEMPHPDALEMISKESGQSFDPEVVAALLRCERDFNNIHNSYKYLYAMFCQIYETNYIGNLSYINLVEKLNIGVKEIDDQHKIIFDEIQSMLKSINTGKWSADIDKTIKFLGKYVVDHFDTEDDFMVVNNYSALSFHQLEHKRLRTNLAKIKIRLSDSNNLLGGTSELILQFAQDEISHILTIDKALGEFLVKRYTF